MENQEFMPDPEEFDHIDDFIDGVYDTDELEEEEIADDDAGCRQGGCMPGPEEFD